MPHIRFIVDYTVQAEGGASYKAGDVVECSDASAGHFTARRVAELCDPPKPVAKPVEEQKPIAKSKGKDAKTDAPTD